MYKLSDEKIEQFLVESSMMQSFLIDDGPPTFYKSFGEYKKNAKSWMNDLYKELGWKVIDYMIRKNAQDPGYDYELRYRDYQTYSPYTWEYKFVIENRITLITFSQPHQ